MSKAGIQPFLLQTMPMILVTLTPTNTGESDRFLAFKFQCTLHSVFIIKYFMYASFMNI